MAKDIQYLYEYENEKPIRNLGFMKVDKQIDKVILQIYGKKLEDVTGIQFRKEDGSNYVAAWQPREAKIQQPPAVTRREEGLREEPEEVDSYIPPSNVRYEKIQRQDLSRLPRREWRIANNNFLLHGFYNYHHLLYIEDGEKVWIGVPGIYHEKEKAAAMAFDFPEFRRLTDMEIELADEEKNTYEDFGYWCRQVEVS